ncbi:siderophore synthetase component [Tumebacillus sp. BK434]|uniref:IucA/IucC family protein n=1 Tax=Tumebacillus sp. BK434 TaxID=2512169 RepID=UPI0010CE04ED|nr:IucA/IucC family protein [Tumebacillus sp. BK434]TCP55755.1 siderophore synthetase component [Tumebacillus sp. BK434]
MNTSLLASALESAQWTEVRRRIFRQLIESLIYEGIVHPETEQHADGTETYRFHGRDAAGDDVTYVCTGRRALSFGRIRLTRDPVLRQANGAEREADSLSAFLLETAELLGADDDKLSTFLEEISETWLKDAAAQEHRFAQPAPVSAATPYDELEADVMEGHPYHPCYKSRIGFDLQDHLDFGPEFKPGLKLIWLAILRAEAKWSHLSSFEAEDFLREELGDEYDRFQDILREKGLDPAQYVFVPVHPWQWREVVAGGFLDQFRKQSIVLLGEGRDEYRPQMSIRTLSNASVPERAYVKCPLSMTNTSTGRILAQHTILNAATLSEWLGELHRGDAYLRDELRVVLLKEVMGVSYHHQGLHPLLEAKVYGVLGAIWRESLHGQLAAGEAAVPFNALCHLRTDGQPLIAPWVERHGLESWLQAVLQVAITPLIHLLYAHGVAMESHAQNMILLHENGLPTRVALKDFHDGLRYSRAHLADPNCRPQIQYPPANHPRLNRNSFIEKEDPAEIKDFFHDAFFFINMGELALFLEEQYGLSETRFWELAAGVIYAYQRKFPELAERFATFDLFSGTIEVEQLTKRRLFAEGGVRVHAVPNPLALFRTGEGR